LETVAAVNRFVSARLERNFGRSSALAANRLEHLALTSAATAAAVTTAGIATAATGRTLSLTGSAAIGATVWFVLKAFGGEKFLLSGAKGELRVTIRASQDLISVHT
jgi:hypothetical protein